MIPVLIRRRSVAAALAFFAFLLIGWSGLLVPSLSREIEDAFNQNDVGLGVFYFLAAAGYAAGSMGGGMVTERLGRRPVLVTAAGLPIARAGTAVFGICAAVALATVRRMPAASAGREEAAAA